MTRFRLAIPVLAVLLVGIGIWLWLTRGQESTDDAQIEAHVVQIAARVGGTVEAVPVKDNQKVEAGATLVQIDPRDFEIAVQKAAAQLADAEASAKAAQSNVTVTATGATSNVASAMGGVSQSKAASEEAERGIEAAREFLAALRAARPRLGADARLHLRFECYNLDAVEEVVSWIEAGLPGQRHAVIGGGDAIGEELPVRLQQGRHRREMHARPRHELALESVAMKVDDARQHEIAAGIDRRSGGLRRDRRDAAVRDADAAGPDGAVRMQQTGA